MWKVTRYLDALSQSPHRLGPAGTKTHTHSRRPWGPLDRATNQPRQKSLNGLAMNITISGPRPEPRSDGNLKSPRRCSRGLFASSTKHSAEHARDEELALHADNITPKEAVVRRLQA